MLGWLLPPSPPAEKATARQDQARQASTCDGTRHSGDGTRHSNGSEGHHARVNQDAGGRIVEPAERDNLVIGRGQDIDGVCG